MKKICLLSSFLTIYFSAFCQMKDVYNSMLHSTILFYVQGNDGNLSAYGTGFTAFNYWSNNGETILITCKHLSYRDTLIACVPVVDSMKTVLRNFGARKVIFDTSNGKEEYYEFDGNNFLTKIPLQLNKNLFRHSTLDLAIIVWKMPTILMDERSQQPFKIVNNFCLAKSYFANKDQDYAGRPICFIGYPFGIGSINGFYNSPLFADKTSNPLIRSGIISWTSDSSDAFLIDGFSFGGNSGSPVISIPDLDDAVPRLIGMITGHLMDNTAIYYDTLPKPIPTKLFGEVNNGLAECIPSYKIYDFIESTMASYYHPQTSSLKKN